MMNDQADNRACARKVEYGTLFRGVAPPAHTGWTVFYMVLTQPSKQKRQWVEDALELVLNTMPPNKRTEYWLMGPRGEMMTEEGIKRAVLVKIPRQTKRIVP